MHAYRYSLISHGSGPLRQFALESLGLLIRFSIGGYGNIPAPAGSWRLLPRAKNEYGYVRAYWLNMSVSIFRAQRAKAHGVLCGFTRVF